MGVKALNAERKMLSERRSDTHTEPRIAEIRKELYLLQHNREVEALEDRKNEALFLENMAKWTEELAHLSSLNLNFNDLQLVREDQRALPPLQPVRPKKLLILALAVMMGGILGMMMALLKIILGREDTKESSDDRTAEEGDTLRVVAGKSLAY